MWIDRNCKLSEENPPPITIQDDNIHAKNIECKQPSEATKAVGVWQDSIGSSAKNMSELIMKVRHSEPLMIKSWCHCMTDLE